MTTYGDRCRCFQFTSIAEEDAGRYICLAENQAGHSEGIAEIIVRSESQKGRTALG